MRRPGLAAPALTGPRGAFHIGPACGRSSTRTEKPERPSKGPFAEVSLSNSFPLEWPPRSGQVRQFPEVDRAAWFDLADARSKIHKGQVALLDEMNSKLGG